MQLCQNIHQLEAAHSTWRSIILCHENDSVHTELLDVCFVLMHYLYFYCSQYLLLKCDKTFGPPKYMRKVFTIECMQSSNTFTHKTKKHTHTPPTKNTHTNTQS